MEIVNQLLTSFFILKNNKTTGKSGHKSWSAKSNFE